MSNNTLALEASLVAKVIKNAIKIFTFFTFMPFLFISSIRWWLAFCLIVFLLSKRINFNFVLLTGWGRFFRDCSLLAL